MGKKHSKSKLSSEMSFVSDFQLIVSYVRNESLKQAIELKKHLTRVGFNKVFLDLDELGAGDNWADALNQAILKCDVFIPLITSKYGITKWTKREIQLADLKDKDIIPINLLEHWPPDCLAIQLASIQYIQWESDTRKIADTIRNRLQRKISFVNSLGLTDKIYKTEVKILQGLPSQVPKPRIVISAHPNQKQFTDFISKELSSEFGFEICNSVDTHNSGHSGNQIVEDFKSEADVASLVLIVLSESYCQSTQCKQQAFYCDFRKRVIPIKYEEFERPDWLSELFTEDNWETPSTDLEWLSCDANDLQSFTENLKQRISKLVNYQTLHSGN